MQTFEQTLTSSKQFVESPFDLHPKQKVIVAVAHPDDEALMVGALQELRRYGHDLIAVVATDGTASTKGDQEFVQAGNRRSEAQVSFGALGLTLDEQRYIGLDDGQLHNTRPLVHYTQTLADIALKHEAAMILTTGEHGFGHRDHRAVHLGALAATTIVRRLSGQQTTVWGLSDRPGEATFAINPREKLERFMPHKSQFDIWVPGDPQAPADAIPFHGLLVSPYTAEDIAAYDLAGLFGWESYNRHDAPKTKNLYDILDAA